MQWRYVGVEEVVRLKSAITYGMSLYVRKYCTSVQHEEQNEVMFDKSFIYNPFNLENWDIIYDAAGIYILIKRNKTDAL